MSISPLIGSPSAATHAPPSGSSAADHLTVKKQQKTKLVAQLKETQNDKSLDSGAKEAKVAQLTAQHTEVDAQIQRLGSQQARTSSDAVAAASPGSGIHVVA